jgi:hypothetical protein
MVKGKFIALNAYILKKGKVSDQFHLENINRARCGGINL